MRSKSVSAGVFALALFLSVAIILVAFRAFATAIQIRYLGSSRSGRLTAATFDMRNRTSDRYFVSPRSIDAQIEGGWKTCTQIDTPPEWELRPYAEKSVTLEMTNVPSGSRLRLNLYVVKELRGWKGLPGLLRLKCIDRLPRVPIFPRDKNLAVGCHEIPLESDEFVASYPTTNMVR